MSNYLSIWTVEKKNIVRISQKEKPVRTVVFAFMEAGIWRLSSELHIGPRLGISEHLYLYDTRDPNPAHALIHRGEMDYEEPLLSLHGLVELRAERKKTAKTRDLAIALCVRSMQDLISRAQDVEGGRLLAEHLQMIAKTQHNSIGGINIGSMS